MRQKLMFLGVMVGVMLTIFVGRVSAAGSPTPEKELEMFRISTGGGDFARATASGAMVFETPDLNLLNVTAIPPVVQSCTKTSSWWLALLLQIVLIGMYLYLRKPAPVHRNLAWLLGISIVSYFVYAAIGCHCSVGGWCSRYYFINLLLLVAAETYCHREEVVTYFKKGKLDW